MENNKLVKYENGLIEKVGNAISVTNKLLKVKQTQSYFEYLRSKYNSHELTYSPGDNQLRYEAFAPLFERLFENKVVYRERFIGIIKLEEITITPERFEAKAIPTVLIETRSSSDKFFFRSEWKFSAVWKHIALNGNHLSSSFSWAIWPEADTVKKVEELALSKRFDDAYKLLD